MRSSMPSGFRRAATATAAFVAALLLAAPPAHAQGGRGGTGQSADTTGAGGAPALAPLVQRARTDSDLRVLVQRFNADRAALGRRYDIPLSPVLHERLRAFHTGWEQRLAEVSESELNEAGRADLAELRTRIRAELAAVAAAERQFDELAPLVPFARPLQALQERRRDRLPIDAFAAAETLHAALEEVRRLTAGVEGAASGGGAAELRAVTPAVASSAATFLLGPEPAPERAGGPPAGGGGGFGSAAPSLVGMLENWYSYSAGYDPLFTWWARKPYEELRDALEAYGRALRAEWRVATD